MTEDKIGILKQLNPKEELIKKCTTEFGLTDDPCEAGFILEDGGFLDFSGKREGGSPHTRVYDHREVSRCMESGDEGMEPGEILRLMSEHGNAVRYSVYGCGMGKPDSDVKLYIDQDPTEKQWKKIISAISPGGNIYYEIYDEKGNRLHEGGFPIEKAGYLRSLFNMAKGTL